MRQICLCLLMLLVCADVAAREVRLSSPDSGACPDTIATPKPAARKPVTPAREAARADETRVRPSVHSDAPTAPRLRWHSFLPGMFR